MCLEKRTYVGNSKLTKPENRHEVLVRKGGRPIELRPDRIKEVVEEVAYWHRAYAIHQWFVDNVQDGLDDCNEHWVGSEQLRELLSRCTRVLEASQLVDGEVTGGYKVVNGKEVPKLEKGKVIRDPSIAKELLPTPDGVLPGEVIYDESYLDALRYTKAVIEGLLTEDPEGDCYYSSSW